MRLKTIGVDEVTIGKRHRKDMGDLQALADSIDAEGLLQPIGITKDSELVYGQRRLLAIRDILGWDRLQAVTIDVTSIVAGEYAENEVREDFTTSERVAIGRTIEEAMPERRGRPSQEEKPDKNVQNLAQIEPGTKTRDVAAERAGFGNRETYRQAAKVVDKGAPELVKAMDEGLAPSIAAKATTLSKAEQKKAAKEYLAGDKSAVKAAVAPVKAEVDYPVSAKFLNWLGSLSAFHTSLRTQHKTVATLLKTKGWEKSQTAYAARLLDAVTDSLTTLNKEMQKHVKHNGK